MMILHAFFPMTKIEENKVIQRKVFHETKTSMCEAGFRKKAIFSRRMGSLSRWSATACASRNPHDGCYDIMPMEKEGE